jgi:hypothetical protein
MKFRDGHDKALFEPFVEPDRDGPRRFANRLSDAKSFRDRTARPFFQPRIRRCRKQPIASIRVHRVSKGIERAAHLAAVRKWLPCHPLLVHLMAVEDAILPRRRKGR